MPAHQSSSLRGKARIRLRESLTAEFPKVRAAWDDGRSIGAMLSAIEAYLLRLDARAAAYRWNDDADVTVWGHAFRNAKPVARVEHAADAVRRLSFYSRGLEHPTGRERLAYQMGRQHSSTEAHRLDAAWEADWRVCCQATGVAAPLALEIAQSLGGAKVTTVIRAERAKRPELRLVAILECVASTRAALSRLAATHALLVSWIEERDPPRAPFKLRMWTGAKYDDAMRGLKSDPSRWQYVATLRRHRKMLRAATGESRVLFAELVALERQEICAMIDSDRLSKELDSLGK